VSNLFLCPKMTHQVVKRARKLISSMSPSSNKNAKIVLPSNPSHKNNQTVSLPILILFQKTTPFTIYPKTTDHPSICRETNKKETSFGSTSPTQQPWMRPIATLSEQQTHNISLSKVIQNLICLVKTNSPETNWNIAQQPVLPNSANLPTKIPKPKWCSTNELVLIVKDHKR